MGTVSPVSQTDMKFLSFLLCVSLNALSLQSRNASRGLWRHQRRFARLWWTSTRTALRPSPRAVPAAAPPTPPPPGSLVTISRLSLVDPSLEKRSLVDLTSVNFVDDLYNL